jgi:hypothetical protein
MDPKSKSPSVPPRPGSSSNKKRSVTNNILPTETSNVVTNLTVLEAITIGTTISEAKENRNNSNKELKQIIANEEELNVDETFTSKSSSSGEHGSYYALAILEDGTVMHAEGASSLTENSIVLDLEQIIPPDWFSLNNGPHNVGSNWYGESLIAFTPALHNFRETGVFLKNKSNHPELREDAYLFDVPISPVGNYEISRMFHSVILGKKTDYATSSKFWLDILGASKVQCIFTTETFIGENRLQSEYLDFPYAIIGRGYIEYKDFNKLLASFKSDDIRNFFNTIFRAACFHKKRYVITDWYWGVCKTLNKDLTKNRTPDDLEDSSLIAAHVQLTPMFRLPAVTKPLYFQELDD